MLERRCVHVRECGGGGGGGGGVVGARGVIDTVRTEMLTQHGRVMLGRMEIAYYAEFAIARWVKRSMLTHRKRFVEVVARRGERCDFTSDATGDGDASTTQIKAR
ncbi:hypothetical protein C0Q70_05832 [Pomacea canaliculata]|uniref:Uncharacterized protein n=1 Tax=Pomacea canaliculata TaxID=400727 RepID=A0A2T7PMA3_POMCA|nr:hypothetical protein C0Q70_05832 [Pomacea canaliculata]